jgi:hypothetical protein
MPAPSLQYYGLLLQSVPEIPLENDLSDLTLEKIEFALDAINTRLAEANDIATLAAFLVIPANLDEESRRALRLLRDKVMARTRTRVGI